MSTRRSLDPQFDLFVPSVADLPLRDQRETIGDKRDARRDLRDLRRDRRDLRGQKTGS